MCFSHQYIFGTDVLLKRGFFAENLNIFSTLPGRVFVSIVLSLKLFKKYWMPLLFWIGVVSFGLLPNTALRVGSRRTVKKTSLVYRCSSGVFILVISRLIFFLLPKMRRGFDKVKLYQNVNLFFFDLNLGDLSYEYFLRFLRFFMKRFRVAVYNNCCARFFFNLSFVPKIGFLSFSVFFCALSKYRIPVYSLEQKF